MSPNVPGYAAHDDILKSLAAAAVDPTLAFGPVEGDREFRTAYANHAKFNSKIMADEVQVTSGCNQAFVAAVLQLPATYSIMMMRPCISTMSQPQYAGD